MNTRNRFALAVGILFVAVNVAFVRELLAQGGNLIAHAQFRRTVDPSDRSATGALVIREDASGKEFVSIGVQGLNLTSLGAALGDTNSFQTNSPIFLIAPLNRANEKKGTWLRQFGPTLNSAPDQFVFFVDHVDELAGLRIDIVTAPPTTNVEGGVTNFVGGVTNIIGNVTNIVGGTTEIVGGTTDLFFSAFLWTPIPPLIAKPSTFNFSKHASLSRPEPPEPSPDANGIIKIKFNAAQGHSILDVTTGGLVAGQHYTLWIANDLGNTNFVNAGDMTLNKSGSGGRFLRDTKFGDPLPQQVGDVPELEGRAVLVKDDFENVHLSGVIP